MNLDPRVTEFFASTYTREGLIEWAERCRREVDELGYGWWVVEAVGVAPFVGNICLREVPFEAHFTPAWEVGWRLAPEFWHRGYATEGARGAIAFGFNTLGLKEIVAMTAVMNLPSQRVMERAGLMRDPVDDFDHPRVDKGHPLERHVLYRINSAA